MKEKLKAHYLKFGPRRFVIFAVMTLIITDVVSMFYLKLYWTAKGMSMMMVERAAQMNGLTMDALTRESIQEVLNLVNNAFTFFLLVIVINNLFFYGFYLKKRLWAQGYVLVYTLTAALFSVTFILEGAGLGMGWLFYNILLIPYYAYVYLGVKLLKAETTLAHGTKAQ